MEEAYETEWQWFRRAIRDSLLRPSAFASSLAREHYGLPGVLVALLARFALSVSVRLLVLPSPAPRPPRLPRPSQVSATASRARVPEPALATGLGAHPPAGGAAVTGDGYQLTLPSRWTEVHLGIAGEIGHFETQTDVLTVLRASGSALVTPDGYAENVGGPWRRGLERTRSSRPILRIGELEGLAPV